VTFSKEQSDKINLFIADVLGFKHYPEVVHRKMLDGCVEMTSEQWVYPKDLWSLAAYTTPCTSIPDFCLMILRYIDIANITGAILPHDHSL
jgi:hypothetical protein